MPKVTTETGVKVKDVDEALGRIRADGRCRKTTQGPTNAAAAAAGPAATAASVVVRKSASSPPMTLWRSSVRRPTAEQRPSQASPPAVAATAVVSRSTGAGAGAGAAGVDSSQSGEQQENSKRTAATAV